ncbi:hypothetical protein LAZ67_5002400, partial [Cordylochernes scorpioides]
MQRILDASQNRRLPVREIFELCMGIIRLCVHTSKVEAQILTRTNVEHTEFVPKIYLASSDISLPFILKRNQFSQKLAFAMTINNIWVLVTRACVYAWTALCGFFKCGIEYKVENTPSTKKLTRESPSDSTSRSQKTPRMEVVSQHNENDVSMNEVTEVPQKTSAATPPQVNEEHIDEDGPWTTVTHAKKAKNTTCNSRK